jgi:hypothetical protein
MSFNDVGYKCYFTDEKGYIFDEAPYFSGNVYFKFYGKDDMDPVNPSGTYFLKDKFTEIAKFVDALQKMNLNPDSFSLGDGNDGSIYLSSTLEAGPKIVFKIDSDYQKIADNLQLAISTDPLQKKIRDNISSLLYIDLRFGNNVYYKFK